MKKNYLFILTFIFVGLSVFSQTLTKFTLIQATEMAKQRNYNEIETTMFIERATGKGIDLSPRKIPNLTPPAPLSGSCVNLDFEQQNFTGWTNATYNISSAFNCAPVYTGPGTGTPNPMPNTGFNFTALNTTSDEHGICTAGADSATSALATVFPFGGTTSCRLGDVTDGCGSAYLAQTFSVSLPDTQISVYFAAILYDGHPPGDAPKFCYRIKTAGGAIVDSFFIDATQAGVSGSSFVSLGGGLYYSPWRARTTSLASYVGQNLTIDFYTSDCDGGAHRGYAYIDCSFGSCNNANSTDLTKINNASAFTVYPNPSNGSFSIETNVTTKQIVTVYDINGKIVLSQFINSTTTIDASKLNDGVYTISIISNEGIVTKKLVIIK